MIVQIPIVVITNGNVKEGSMPKELEIVRMRRIKITSSPNAPHPFKIITAENGEIIIEAYEYAANGSFSACDISAQGKNGDFGNPKILTVGDRGGVNVV